MNEEQIFDVIRPIILSVTGVPECILGDPNKPAPAGTPYAAVRPKQTISEIGQANINRTSQAGIASVNEDVRSQILAECSVNFYRGDAIDYAEKLKQAYRRYDVFQSLFSAGIGWMRTGPINNLTALQSNQWEKRAQISLFLTYEISSVEIVNSIERISTQYEYEDGSIIQNVSVQTDDAP